MTIKVLPSKTATELAIADYPNLEPFWGPAITSFNLALLYAPRGVGKTNFCLQLAHSLATGTKFLKWCALRPLRVIYFDGEMGDAAITRRLLKIDNTSPVSVIGDNLHFWSFQLGGEAGMLNLASLEDQKEYDKLITSFDVVIIDSLMTCTRRVDKFDDEFRQWERIQQWAIKNRDLGKAIIFVHHTNKQGFQSGWTQKENIVDTIIALQKPKFEKKIDGLSFELRFEKARNFWGENAEALYVEALANGDEMNWLYWPLEEHVAAMIADSEDPIKRAMAEKVGLPAWRSRETKEKKRVDIYDTDKDKNI